MARLAVHHPAKTKGHGFDSWLGRMPGLRAWSWSGRVQEITDQSHIGVSLPFSLPSLSLKNKQTYFKNERFLFSSIFHFLLFSPNFWISLQMDPLKDNR